MSAITGICYLDDRRVEAATIETMLHSLQHRGKDGSRTWHDESTALGHAMLHVTPESLGERLPLEDPAAGLVITADARIDNRTELITMLGLNWPTPPPDSQLILAAYRKWGDGCPTRLIGDFAFAIWDSRRRRLFAARSPFGVKPFYYAAKSGRFFAFGTEIRPLLTLPEVSQEIRETKIADHMDVRLEDQVGTFYRDVFRLPGAHTLTVNPSGLGIARYWQLDRDKELRLASDEEYVDGYREHLTEAVRARTRTAFPIGSMLSGGLDSSSVACIGRNVLELEGRGPLHTFSAVFDVVQASDERPYIDAVLATGGFRPHFIDGDRKDPFSDLNQMLRRQEVPANAYNAFLFDELMQLANQSGVRVVLDGMGGDSTVSHGWRRLNDLAASFRWIVLARELRLFGSRLGKSRWQAYRDLIWASGLKPHAPLWLKRSVRRVVGRRSTPVAAPSTFVRATFSDEITRDRSPTRGEVFGPLDTSRELHFSQVATGELPAAMEVTDKIGGWLDLEFRYPFLDRRLVEYCLSLPADLKLRDGWTRYVARVAGTAYLPAEVQWRSDKGNLGYSFHHVLMTIGRSQVEEAIFARRDALDRYLDVDALQDALRRCASDEWTFDDAGTLWLATVLGGWLESATRPPS